MPQQALLFWGGWQGHQPEQVAHLLAQALRDHGFEVEVSNTLDCLKDGARLKTLRLIVPVWTMGAILPEQEKPLLEAVESGVGLGGCHGGMCDSFRNNTAYQFMTGGQWVAHPGNDGVRYTVQIRNPDHFITSGTRDFEVASEQYYLHVDPANQVLATTPFPVAPGPHTPNGHVDMPVVWTKYYGQGRVFYCSLGHQATIVAQPEVLRLCTRGLLWAARAEESARV